MVLLNAPSHPKHSVLLVIRKKGLPVRPTGKLGRDKTRKKQDEGQ